MKRTVYASYQWLLENYQDVEGNYNSDDSVDTDDMDSIYLAGSDEKELPDDWNIIGSDEDSYFTADEDIESSIATVLRRELTRLSGWVKMNKLCDMAGVSVDSYKRPERLTPTTRIKMYEKLLETLKNSLGN